MKKEEFLKIKDKFTKGQKVVIRYFTYNKNHYVDIIGEFDTITKTYFQDYDILIKNYEKIKYYTKSPGKMIPNLKAHILKDEIYINIKQGQIHFIMDAHQYMRAIKSKQLKKRING